MLLCMYLHVCYIVDIITVGLMMSEHYSYIHRNKFNTTPGLSADKYLLTFESLNFLFWFL